MYIIYHKYRKLDTGSCYKTFVFLVRNCHVFLPQVLYHKPRGRDEEHRPGLSFKLVWLQNTKKHPLPLYTHSKKEHIARYRKGYSLVMRLQNSTHHVDMVPL